MNTRRDFIKLAVAGVATSAMAESAQPKEFNRAQPVPSGSIAVHITAGDKRFQQQSPLTWSAAKPSSKDVIVLDERHSYQEMLGFGAALTDAACHNFNALTPAKRDRLLHELFDPSEMACSVSRLCIGSSDYSCKPYTYCDGEADPELKRFSIEHDQANIIPVLRAVRAINPDVFFLASPWSPPGWMKSGGSTLGGAMTKRNYANYARYIVRFLQEYDKEGVRINALTSQNEVDTDQDGRMPACLWGQEYEAEFIVRELGPQLRKSNLNTRIWLLDHNYDLWGRATCQLDNADLNPYVDGVAWHGYAGKPDAMTRVHASHPEKHMYFTEGGSDFAEPGYATSWCKWSATFAGILRNWARCIITWNYVLDENGRPNIGPFGCAGMMTINSQTGEVTRNGIFWALAHYSRVVRRGARRIDSNGEIAGLSHVAFVNPDKSYCAVLTNAGAARNVVLQLGASETQIALEPDSVTTLTWSI